MNISVVQAAAVFIIIISGFLFAAFYPFSYKTTVSINSVCSFSVFDNDSLVSIKKAENELELLNKRIIRIRQEQKIDNLVFLDLCIKKTNDILDSFVLSRDSVSIKIYENIYSDFVRQKKISEINPIYECGVWGEINISCKKVSLLSFVKQKKEIMECKF